jgi:predicted phosphodiesterase
MTRLAVLADIHGNLPALQAIIKDMADFKVDHVIALGDNISWGPFSTQVMEEIANRNWAVIRGNHELYMLDYLTPRAPDNWRHYKLPRWLNETIPTYWKNVIAALPDALSLRYPDAPDVRVFHATPQSHWDGIFYTTPDNALCDMLGGIIETTVLCGHTHLALDRTVGRWRILNPGSVGAPLDGYSGASYLLLDSNDDHWNPTFRRIEYDDSAIFTEFDRVNFVDSCGATARLIIEEFRLFRPIVYPFNRWRNEVHNGEPETLDMAEEFLQLDFESVWRYMPPEYVPNNENLTRRGDA